MNKPLVALTGQEVIDLIIANDAQDSPIAFTHNYGDHWRTQVVVGVETGEHLPIEWSGYHSKHKLKKDDDEEEMTKEQFEEKKDNGGIAFILS